MKTGKRELMRIERESPRIEHELPRIFVEDEKGGIMFIKRGFTLVELVMVIVILAILAAVAIPKYYDLQTEAKAAAEKGVVGGVRAGIHTYYAKNKAWPTNLDSAADGNASTTNAFFTTVLSQGGITSDWSKAGSVYTGPSAGTYTYDNTDGSFD